MVFAALVVPLASTALATHVANSTLEITEEVDSNPTGATHTLTAVMYTDVTQTVSAQANPLGVNIDFEVESGPAVRAGCTDVAGICGGGTLTDADNSPLSPDLTCTIPQNASSCQVVFTSDTQGANVVRAWVDEDRSNTTVEADTTEGRYSGGPDSDPTNANPGEATPAGAEATDCRTPADWAECKPTSGSTTPVGGGTTEPDTTDVVAKAWTQSVAAACLDAEPETKTNPSGSDHVITAKATSSAATITDLNGTFECTGSALANTTVNITVNDDDPNIFIKAVNGTSTGGPIGGGPNGPVNGTTDANGQVTATIACVSGAAANCTGANTVTLAVQGAIAGSSSDQVTKTWAPGGTAFNLDATPETATNEVGQTHTITCSSTDQFGNGVAGTNCDAQVSAGPNSNNDIGTDANTTDGYVGQCTTGAAGTCTISYTSAELGTDTIEVFNDANGNDLQTATTEDDYTADPNTADKISKTWVAVGGGTADVDIDMSNTAGNLAECDDIANGTDDVNDDSTATNPVATAHEVCAERFGPTGVAQAGLVTFTIVSGPGEFFNDADGDGTRDTGELSLGATFVAEEGTCNTGATLTTFNCVSVYSTATGNTVVQASANGQTAQGTKTWTNVPADARNIKLTVPAEAQPDDVAQASALVKDVFGNPVPGVAVTFGETGPAIITSANAATTDANGVAEVLYTSAVEGTSTVTASLPTTGGVDECEKLAGNPVGATAGNCTDSGVTEWTAPPLPPEPTVTNHARSNHLNRFKHINFGGGRRSLKVSGTLSTDGFDACSANQKIKVQIRASGEWITRKSDTTNANGKFKVLLRDIAKKYRAVAKKSFIVDGDGNIDNCLRAVSNVRRHRHRHN